MDVSVYACAMKPRTSFIRPFRPPSELLSVVLPCMNCIKNEHRYKSVLVISGMLCSNIAFTRSYRRLCASGTCPRLLGTRRKHCVLFSSRRPSLLPTFTSARPSRLAASLLPVAPSCHLIPAQNDRVFVRASFVILGG